MTPSNTWRAARTPSKGLEEISNHVYQDGYVRSLVADTDGNQGVFGLGDLKELLIRDEDALYEVLRNADSLDLTIGELSFVYLRNAAVLGELETMYGAHMVLAIDSARQYNSEPNAALAWAVAMKLIGNLDFEAVDDIGAKAKELGITFDEAIPYMMHGIYDMARVRAALDTGVDPALASALERHSGLMG